jgi:hypothetical protein
MRAIACFACTTECLVLLLERTSSTVFFDIAAISFNCCTICCLSPFIHLENIRLATSSGEALLASSTHSRSKLFFTSSSFFGLSSHDNCNLGAAAFNHAHIKGNQAHIVSQRAASHLVGSLCSDIAAHNPTSHSPIAHQTAALPGSPDPATDFTTFASFVHWASCETQNVPPTV